MGRLTGKKTVVVGGSNGIGRAIVEAFVSEGADVFFTAHKDEIAAKAAVQRGKLQGVEIAYMLLDGRGESSVASLFKAAVAFHGRIDVLVNNAASISRTRFLDISMEEYSVVLDTNLRFPFFATQRFALHMKEADVRGSIINVSSISASRAVSKMAAYQCSKAGLSMLTRGAAYELAEFGIRVNTLSPGLTATNANMDQWRDDPELWRHRSKDIPLGRAGVARDHAGAAVFLASDESSWMTGAEIIIDGGSSVI